MSEDLIPKPITPSIYLNDEIDEDTDAEVEYDKNDMYIVHLNDVHYKHIDNTNDVYIDVNDITVVYIVKENFEKGIDFKEMMRSRNNIAFLNPKKFL
jgi:hypothetical protein